MTKPPARGPARPAARARKKPSADGAAGGARAAGGTALAGSHLDQLLAGSHADPFAFLGRHPLPGGGWVVRAFGPDAGRAWVLAEGGEIEMKRVHEAGLFEATLPEAAPPPRYRLRFADRDGVAWEVDDPYGLPPWLGELDLHLIAEGRHQDSWERLGAHLLDHAGLRGVAFAVWAPNARGVSVVGDFNRWDGRRHPMRVRGGSGVWELFVPGLAEGDLYKYEIRPRAGGPPLLKADPYAFAAELRPRTASRVVSPAGFEWRDAEWLQARARRDPLREPLSIYEVHLGSWRRVPEEGDRFLTYRESAEQLADYCAHMGYTHVQLMPVMEHPFDGSWGYQVTGYFAPTSRFGTPRDFMGFVDHLHRRGIGVILDWVPSHFPDDPHGLAWFDGTHLYEHADPRQGFHPDWHSLIFNYGRNEVVNFLVSNAHYWFDRFHVDGLRVDAVASMLYLDYSRRDSDWIPNRYGGRENLEAIEFLRRVNELAYGRHPGIMTIAEESTAWPMVSRPTYAGGLGFGLKWNMGWMHDVLGYLGKDPVYRRFHHHDLTFGLLYAFHENFILSLSHDEVVHGKRSLLDKMPGDMWQKFANLRLLFTFMHSHPGKKLHFMGGEFGQWSEWSHDRSLDWHLTRYAPHAGVQRLVADLNRLHRGERALHQVDFEPAGFEWIEADDAANSALTFVRRALDPADFLVCAFNFTPVPRAGYRMGVPEACDYVELLNSDSGLYGGGNLGNAGRVRAEPVPAHGRPASVVLTLPPLAGVILKPARA
jgi:1,4-alpha-glucan branching enzyme